MVSPSAFFGALRDRGIRFYTGVPDSLLKDFCAYITDHSVAGQHVIAANEGGAVALAGGHYLATGSPALVYMQNSGQGNAVNPLTSLADPDVFGLPMLLMVGWRGEPGHDDEPQHVKQGKITRDLFRTLGVDHQVLPDDDGGAVACVDRALTEMRRTMSPFALVVRDGTFGRYGLSRRIETTFELSREAALGLVLEAVLPGEVVVATTGKTAREMFEYRERQRLPHDTDFRTVGCMGHASQIALGIALAQPERAVYCLDGDGAVLMHMGALAIIGTQNPTRFRHVVFNNGAHDSVGGQPTAGLAIDLPAIATACGYRLALRAETASEVVSSLQALNSSRGPGLVEIRVNTGSRSDLGRPSIRPRENKDQLMRAIAVR